MMRWDGFARSVGFAALAATGSAAWLLCVAPALGGWRALALWLVAVTAAYGGGLGGGVRRRVAATVVAAVVGLGIVGVAPGIRGLVVALAVVLGVARSGWVHRATLPRTVTTEAVLLGGGLAVAAALAGPSVRGVMLGVWGFFLVQSFYFLLPGAGAGARRAGERDPFAAAHASALALLERGPM